MKNYTKPIAELCLKHNITIGAAESCSGGNIAHKITKLAGSSTYFKGSIVSYASETKINVLNVDKELINKYSAESENVARQMAKNVKELLNVDYTVATSGNLGPNLHIRTSDGYEGNFVFISVSGPKFTYTVLHDLPHVKRTEQISIVTKLALELLHNTIIETLNSK